MTVAELRARLDQMERAWCSQEERNLGPFANQRIFVDVFAPGGEYQGLGEARTAFFDHCTGVLVLTDDTDGGADV